MSYLRAIKDGNQYRFSLKSASDKTSGLFPAVKTHNTGDGNFSGLLTNVPLKAGRTYYVKVKFRTRGDGNSTSSKCSSIGFITWGTNWSWSKSYIHNSATAYAEIGKIVEWTYSFTVDSDLTPQGTALYFIINNAWANGNDAQTIDLYYYKYWDSEGNIYNENFYGKNEEIKMKWFDGTDLKIEKTTTTSLKMKEPVGFLSNKIFKINKCLLEFDAKSIGGSDSVEVGYTFKNSDTVLIVSGVYALTTSYQHFSIELSSLDGNTLYIIFGRGSQSGNTSIQIKNVTIKPTEVDVSFLKLQKNNNNVFYTRFYNYGRLKLNVSEYCRECCNLSKNQELRDKTYDELEGYFEY